MSEAARRRPANEVLRPEQIEQLRDRVHKLYGRQHLYDQCQVWVDKNPTTLRHEDPVLDGSGTWVDISVFVPDEKAR